MNRKELLLTISNLERVSTPRLSSSKSSSLSISMTRNDRPVFIILVSVFFLGGGEGGGRWRRGEERKVPAIFGKGHLFRAGLDFYVYMHVWVFIMCTAYPMYMCMCSFVFKSTYWQLKQCVRSIYLRSLQLSQYHKLNQKLGTYHISFLPSEVEVYYIPN